MGQCHEIFVSFFGNCSLPGTLTNKLNLKDVRGKCGITVFQNQGFVISAVMYVTKCGILKILLKLFKLHIFPELKTSLKFVIYFLHKKSTFHIGSCKKLTLRQLISEHLLFTKYLTLLAHVSE